ERVKDSINDAVVSGDYTAFDNADSGTKCSPLYNIELKGNEEKEIRLRLSKKRHSKNPLKKSFDSVFEERKKEADEFYSRFKTGDNSDHQNIQRQAFAGMLWTKQFYYIDIPQWLDGDDGQVPPPERRKHGRNADWRTLNNRDIISMPDKWEYPWYAAWDLAFHCVPLAMVDTQFAKDQLILFLREWYMKPNGQIPAYEWAFGDVNPPVHAWACMQIYKMEKENTGKGDTDFLKKVFQKLLINFTWWVNRKDKHDKNVFEGGFLGLDNIGMFDRSSQIPGGGHLEQADGTSWMAMYCLNMLEMALEIAQDDPAGFEDVATKFLEHFVYISEAINCLGLENDGCMGHDDGFFYDVLVMPDGQRIPLKVRSLVGLTTLFATLVVKKEYLEKLPDFTRRLKWFRKYRQGNHRHLVIDSYDENGDLLLSLVPLERLPMVLNPLLSEEEFFSPYGIRSLSKVHEDPYIVNIQGQDFDLKYEPAESRTGLFGGNSNWRGPIWTPMNYLLIQSLKELHSFYGDECLVQCPYNDDKKKNLGMIADDISANLISMFEKREDSSRPIHALHDIYQKNPDFNDLILFYEYFHGDNGRGVGASHQTGWTGIIAELIDSIHNHPAK
ncbi:MAG: MGH1-like glycoside hydrolase domain-containing protein, partial [Balneolaceae bacterium]